MALQVNLPACSPHCPFHAERQAGSYQYQFYSHWFDPTAGIKPHPTALQADALSTQPSELFDLNYCNFPGQH